MNGHEKHMKQIKRERKTECKVRALDDSDIVHWVHKLEDEIVELKSSNADLCKALEDALLIVDMSSSYRRDDIAQNARIALAKEKRY